MDTRAVNEALNSLRASFSEDGFDLRVSHVNDAGEVEVTLEAKPGACLDCLVPEDVMLRILESAIRDRYPALRSVMLRRLGFESLKR